MRSMLDDNEKQSSVLLICLNVVIFACMVFCLKFFEMVIGAILFFVLVSILTFFTFGLGAILLIPVCVLIVRIILICVYAAFLYLGILKPIFDLMSENKYKAGVIFKEKNSMTDAIIIRVIFFVILFSIILYGKISGSEYFKNADEYARNKQIETIRNSENRIRNKINKENDTNKVPDKSDKLLADKSKTDINKQNSVDISGENPFVKYICSDYYNPTRTIQTKIYKGGNYYWIVIKPKKLPNETPENDAKNNLIGVTLDDNLNYRINFKREIPEYNGDMFQLESNNIVKYFTEKADNSSERKLNFSIYDIKTSKKLKTTLFNYSGTAYFVPLMNNDFLLIAHELGLSCEKQECKTERTTYMYRYRYIDNVFSLVHKIKSDVPKGKNHSSVIKGYKLSKNKVMLQEGWENSTDGFSVYDTANDNIEFLKLPNNKSFTKYEIISIKEGVFAISERDTNGANVYIYIYEYSNGGLRQSRTITIDAAKVGKRVNIFKYNKNYIIISGSKTYLINLVNGEQKEISLIEHSADDYNIINLSGNKNAVLYSKKYYRCGDNFFGKLIKINDDNSNEK